MKTEIEIAIQSERNYQEAKWPGHKHTVAEWILIMEKCLADAKLAWVSGHGDDKALDEIRQVTAVGVAAMEQHGAPLRPAWHVIGCRAKAAKINDEAKALEVYKANCLKVPPYT